MKSDVIITFTDGKTTELFDVINVNAEDNWVLIKVDGDEYKEGHIFNRDVIRSISVIEKKE